MVNKKRQIAYEFLSGDNNKVNLVFVHGTCCNKQFLRPLAEVLEGYNRYLIDLPGHGDSDDTGYSAENYIDAIKDFVSDLDNVVLIGHSLGGALVIGIGELNLPTVKAIISLNGASDFSNLDQGVVDEVNKGIFNMDTVSRMIGHTDHPLVQAACAYLEGPELWLTDFKIDLVVNYSKDLDKINVPTLIIGGGADILVYPSKSEELHNKIKNSELLIIPDTMHSLPLVKRDETAKAIDEFIIKNQL